MKKLFYSMLALAVSAMTFTSCEDVPAPYSYPEAEGDGVYLNTSFANSLSPWTSYVTEGEDGLNWTNAYSSAVCSGSWAPEGSSQRVNHAGTAWLVSPTLDLSKAEKVRVSFDHAIAYERTQEIFNHHVLMYSTDYEQGNAPSTATWTRIDFSYGSGDHSGGNYNFEQTGANLTEEMLVDGIVFAFVYESTTQNASTWEVKNFLCMEGEYTEPGGGDDESAEFKKASGIVSGQTYAIGAAEQVSHYEVATALTSNYGYLQKTSYEYDDANVIYVSDNQKFVFTAVDGGYTIQDADGKYMYMKGTYNSFNRSDDMSDAEGCYVWTISFNENGTVNITNKDKGKTIMYDGQYSSYGAYDSDSNSRYKPFLFTNGETEGDQGGGTTPDDPTPGEKGTADNPYTVAEAIDIINGLDDNATTASEVYVKGKLTADASTWYFNSQYGQCNYYISDDGSSSNTIQVYNGKDLNNTDFTATRTYKQGSDVVIFGKLQKYVKDGTVTPELARGNYIVSITEGQSGGDEPSTGHGMSADDPYTVAEALEIINAIGDEGGYAEGKVYVKGKISSNFQYYSNYKNCNYYISDTGTRDNELYIYAGNDLNNAQFEAAPNYQVGYTVVIYGQLQKYVKNGEATPEMAKGNYIVSIDQSGGGDEPGGDDPVNPDQYTVTRTVDEDAMTVTFTVEGMDALAYYEADIVDGQIINQNGLAHQAANPVVEMPNELKFIFAQGGGTTTPKYWATGDFNEFRMYAKNTLTIQPTDTPVSKVVLHCTQFTNNGQTTKYLGNDTAYGEVDGNNLIIVNEHTAASGGTQLRIDKITVWYPN